MQEDIIVQQGGMSHPAVTIRANEDYKVVYYDNKLVMCTPDNRVRSTIIDFNVEEQNSNSIFHRKS